MVIRFFAPGVPQGQGNHRVSRAGRVYETNSRLSAWRDTVANVARMARLKHRAEPLDEPVEVAVVFRMPRPKRPKFDEPAVPPDLDKLQRALGDALTTSGVIADDSRIVRWHPEKRYADRDHPAGATVAVWPTSQRQNPREVIHG